MTSCPSLKEAISLWQESLNGVLHIATEHGSREYIFHTTGIAEAASTIASKCGLDEEKAYILGLLHDYGKMQSQKQTGVSHIMFGYNVMKSKGWDDVAKICLSHSFPEKDFKISDYPSYPDIVQIKKLVSDINYDDYDRLIQLCDIFFEGNKKISYQKRIACIRQRYGLTKEQTSVLEIKAKENKKYFDDKCGQDIYVLLGIRE